MLGEDAKTGLPLELSIDLQKNEEGSISIHATPEKLATMAHGSSFGSVPDLIVEEVPAFNVRRISIRIRELGKPPQE